jgi:hypothetical protein
MPLINLPNEVLHQIAASLSCQSALDRLLVCRSLYRTCDAWVVWRAVATHSGFYPGTLPALETSHRYGWKRYVVAAAKASKSHRDYSNEDLRGWLPQLTALRCPVVLQRDPSSLARLFSATLYDPTISRGCEPALDMLGKSFDRIPLPTWLLAQAVAFSLAVCLFSQPPPAGLSRDPMRTGPWLLPNASDLGVLSRRVDDKLVAAQHTLANLAVGFFCARLRSARAASASTVGVFPPPSAATIPFWCQMDLPLPFSEQGLETFCRCHRPAMVDPTFFTDDDWTGCTSIPVAGDYWFNAIGGSHADGFDRPGLSAPPGAYPHGRAFESVVRFQLSREDQCGYRLQSNNFHSEAGLHKIQLVVDRRTGQVIIYHWHPMMADFMTSYGVVTPFGIVSWLLAPGMWMWLWKVSWSASTE